MAEENIGKKVRALWDYETTRDDELTLEEDDIILVLAVFDGWYEGECNGQRGLFPANYVEVIDEAQTNNEPSVFDKIAFGNIGAEGISAEQNKTWYQNYKKTNAPSNDVPDNNDDDDDGEPTPERTIRRATPRVIIGQPVALEPPKWFDKVDPGILAKLSDTEKKRQEVIFELIKTEGDYVNDLVVIIDIFLEPIRTKKLLNQKDIVVLFSNIKELLPVNQELLRTLVERREKDQILMNVGDIFVRISDYLKMYNMYCSNHPYSLMKFENLKSKQWKSFLMECFANPQCRSLDLCSFLIKPVQRICKYPLLIREIMKHTPDSHPDRQNLTNAFQKIELVVAIVNEATRQAEFVQKTLQLQARFTTKVSIMLPTRKLLFDSEMQEVKDNKMAKKERSVYLFNDLIIIAKPAGDKKLKLVAFIPAENLGMQVGEENKFTVEDLKSQERFGLQANDMSTKQKFVDELNIMIEDEVLRKKMKAENDEEEDVFDEEMEPSPSPALPTPSPVTPSPISKTAPAPPSQPPKTRRISNAPPAQTPITPPQPQAAPTSSASTQARMRHFSQPTTSEVSRIQSDLPSKPLPGRIQSSFLNNEPEKPPASRTAAQLPPKAEFKRMTTAPMPSTNDDEPEFRRVQLRKTQVYDDAAVPSKSSTPPPEAPKKLKKSRSVSDLDDKPKQGFWTSFKNMFSRKKDDSSTAASSASLAKTSKRQTAPPSTTASSSSVPSSTTARPAGSGGGQVSSRVSVYQEMSNSSTSMPTTTRAPRVQGTGVKRSTQVTGEIKAAAIMDFFALANRDYVYVIRVSHEAGSCFTSKTYDDFYNFHMAMIMQFKEEAGLTGKKRVIPDLPPQCAFVSETVAVQRRRGLDNYIQTILRLPPKISASLAVKNFLKESPTPKKGGAPPAATGPVTSSTVAAARASYGGARAGYSAKPLPNKPAPTARTGAPPRPTTTPVARPYR